MKKNLQFLSDGGIDYADVVAHVKSHASFFGMLEATLITRYDIYDIIRREHRRDRRESAEQCDSNTSVDADSQ